MKTYNYRKLAVLLAGSALLFAACTQDVYEPTDPAPGPDNKEGITQDLKDFAFTSRSDVKLSVNYNAPGFKALINVYKENPVDKVGNLIAGIKPVYSAYTDNNGKLEADMYIPADVKEAYLFTYLIGLPRCVKMEATTGGFTYDATKEVTKTKAGMTRAASDWVDTSSFPYKVKANGGGTRTDNVYSLVTWDANGKPSGDRLTTVSKVGDEQIGVISKRVTSFLVENNVDVATVGNKKLLRDPNQINIKAPADGAEITVTYVGSKGDYHNSFGYYYYKNEADVTGGNIMNTKKYIIFPHAHQQALAPGAAVKLVYFDEQTGQQSDKFPAGYTVGWFLISNGFAPENNSYLKKINGEWFSSAMGFLRNACTSNETGDYRQFITVYDQTSKLRIVGIEDLYVGQDDFMDLTFFVSTTPDIPNEDLEEVPGEEESMAETHMEGTLAFEDIWPYGGDFDMNDVAVEYTRDIKSNGNNEVQSVSETFKFTQNADAASFVSYFAYTADVMGSITSKSENVALDNSGAIGITKSAKDNFVQDPSARTVYKIERALEGAVSLHDCMKDFNPFIVVTSAEKPNWNVKDRKEVHLPMKNPTTLFDTKLSNTGTEGYFMDINGKCSFALDIPVVNFVLSPERTSIAVTYPKFESWVTSRKEKDQDWYLYPAK